MKNRTTYRKLLAVLLLSVYLFTSFKGYLPYISYSLNYQYFSTVLCENKEKPKLKCEGKCQLKKNIQKNAEEESKKQTAISIEVEEIPSEEPYCQRPQYYLLREVSFSYYSEQYHSNTLNHITPPPKA